MIDLLSQPPEIVAPNLLGWRLVTDAAGSRVSGTIVETEAYSQTDAASHSYRGKTSRTEVMFGPAGHAYIYFTYGMHYCMNVVTGKTGEGSAVLLRALEPIEGLATMFARRGVQDHANLTNGPAKLCQALAIDRRFNGRDLLDNHDLFLLPPIVYPEADDIVVTTRIGITKDIDRPWRFYLKNNRFVSRK